MEGGANFPAQGWRTCPMKPRVFHPNETHTQRFRMMRMSLLGESTSRRTDSQNVGQQRLFGIPMSVRARMSSSACARECWRQRLARTQSQKHAANHTIGAGGGAARTCPMKPLAWTGAKAGRSPNFSQLSRPEKAERRSPTKGFFFLGPSSWHGMGPPKKPK